MRKEQRDILDVASVAAIRHMDRGGLEIDEAVEEALDAEVEYGHHNNGNSWYRTTARRYGFTHRGLKRALSNRMNNPAWVKENYYAIHN